MASFKLDEGFSEASGFMDVRDEGGAIFPEVTKAAVEEWIMAQDEDGRREIAFEVLRTLKSSSVTSIINKLTLLLQRDPVQRLPAEIVAEIFALLDAPVLLTASLVCKTWRQRILDSQLWKRLYASEGWGVDKAAIQAFENTVASRTQEFIIASMDQSRDSGIDVAEPKQKRRAPANWLEDRQRNVQMSPLPMSSTLQWNEQHGKVEADTGSQDSAIQAPDADQIMDDVSSPKTECPPSTVRSNKRTSRDLFPTGAETRAVMPPVKRSSSGPAAINNLNVISGLKPSLTLFTPSGMPKVNWLHLYKQRRRLEENWNNGRYINYQLPKVGYEHEGHRECVYTIQFFDKWLVSGSRDHTMRIWDLETRRVKGAPLVGHTQSVLCLQFDPTPEEDVIISGSSDTTVKIWKFSTGQLLQTLQAHKESVLNLRFDHRYLVTCSKDKLIKIWNRREMDPTSPHYPKINHKSNAHLPSYIVDTSGYNSIVLEQKIASRAIRTLSPYTLLMQLDGHGAAVNAIQIEGDRIVSASGDRNIKTWDIKDGRLLHTLLGHHKGIACVQFDGKRIVSGSSDNTIRIFDQVTGAEVACLHGHDNLVRTVQAGFGDLPGSEQELRRQAEAAERKWREMNERGEIPRQEMNVRRRPRYRSVNERERQIVALGAALPAGGGGSRWGRIVSGSYDEHVIIWRKNTEGKWLPAHRLGHAEASHIATAIGAAALAAPLHPPLIEGDASRSTATSLQTLLGPRGPTTAPANLLGVTGTAAATTAGGIPPANPGLHLQGQAPGAHQALLQLQNHAQMMNQTIAQHNHQAFAEVMRRTATAAPVAVPVVNPQLGHLAGHHHQTGPHRVFKLQFDSRKIVCCSQDPRIVIWDFANGDREIEDCSQFFTGP